MDEFLNRLGMQAMNYAMRCGIALTSSFAMQQCSRLLKAVDNKPQHAELQALKRALDNKIKIISPALDLIEFRSGRGNIFLENAAVLAKTLHRDIVTLGKRLENAAVVEELRLATGSQNVTDERRQMDISIIISEIKALLARIDGDIPLIQLAITASGESLSASLPTTISPSRLLQASMFLTLGDMQFDNSFQKVAQIGPSFTLSLYMLFLGHSSTVQDTENQSNGSKNPSQEGDTESRPYGIHEGERKPIWQEVLHKARVRLCRTAPDCEFDQEAGYVSKVSSMAGSRKDAPSDTQAGSLPRTNGYAYHLEIIEDLEDGRVHDDEEVKQHTPCAYSDIRHAGIRESIPIHQIAKIFYTDTGRILNIGGASENNAILLLKRDTNATAPEKMRNLAEDLETEPMGSGARTGASQRLLTSSPSCEQEDVDRQLRGEIGSVSTSDDATKTRTREEWGFPHHLDPEWLALEVFVEDDDDVESDEGEDTTSDAENGERNSPAGFLASPKYQQKVSTGFQLTDRLSSLSISSPKISRVEGKRQLRLDRGNMQDSYDTDEHGQLSYASGSPFGKIASSLSLLEMLIRFTSLQEFQQTSHLSIPDHILIFFLEETSTTGLSGEDQWKAKNEAKRRMGFDPYTDTPKH